MNADHIMIERVATAIRRARRLAGVDAARSAELLRDHSRAQPEVPTVAAVLAWENGDEVPSAVVLLAAAKVAGVELELLFARAPVLLRLRALEQEVRRQSAELQALRRQVG